MQGNVYNNTLTKNALVPQLIAGSSAIDGVTIDTLGFDSMVFTLMLGATAGAPSAAVFTFAIWESDNSDMSGATIVSTQDTADLPASGLDTEVSVDLEVRKRYQRTKVTPAFTGGSSPSIATSVSATLGEPKYAPVTK